MNQVIKPEQASLRGHLKVGVGNQPPRVAVVCDFLEEGWPSMDLAGDMLYQSFSEFHSGQVAADKLRPEFHNRFARIPMIPSPLGKNLDRVANRFFDYPRWLRSRAGDFDLFHLVDHSY